MTDYIYYYAVKFNWDNSEVSFQPLLVHRTGEVLLNTLVSKLVFACGVSTSVMGASLAHAQSNTTQTQIDRTEASGSGQNNLEEIIVTANRKAEPLQTVPVTVSVISDTALRRENIVSNQDLSGKVPSLVVGQSSGQRSTQSFTLRGQGSTYGGGPGVAAYFAEVPVPSASDTVAQLGTNTMFYDLQNIQVLKGPQGTLFGRNTTGGAVLLEPKQPQDELGGYLQGQIGNYDDREIEGMMNLPIVNDKLLLRVAGRFVDREGYTRDVSGRDFDDRHYWAARMGLTWRPVDGVENQLLVTAFRSDTNGSGSVIRDFNFARDANGRFVGATARFYGEAKLRQVLAEQRARGPRRVELSVPQYEKQQMWMAVDKLNIEVSDNLTIRNIISYARYKTSTEFDLDGSILDIDNTSSGDFNATDARQWTEEFQIQGSAFGDHLEYVAGAYYEDVKPLGPEFRGGQRPSLGTRTRIFSGDTRYSVGVYAQGSLSLGAFSPSLEKLRITAGGRYTWDRRDSFYQYNINGNCLLATATLPDCEVSAKTRNSAPTWTFGIDYQITPQSLIFAKVSRGYKSGGFNFNGTNPGVLTFGPERVTTYEIGVKSQFHIAGMPTRLNTAAYYSDYRDIQRVGSSVMVLPNGQALTGSATTNAGKAHIQGVEIEGSIVPTSGLVISGGYSYTDAKYDEFFFRSIQNGVVVIDDRKNVPFQFAVKNQYNISVSYAIDLGAAGEITPSATFAHVDRYYDAITMPSSANPYNYMPASNLLNLRLDWHDVAGKPLDLAFFVTNATNKTFAVQGNTSFATGGSVRYFYNEPRMFGAQLRWRFGGER